MSLDVPDLDDRRFEEMMEDVRKRIPVHSEAWTDHNAHDPGITILELLAWLAESYGYQLNQVTDAHLRKYLDLVGTTPRPPRRATGRLTLADVDDFDGQTLPSGTPLAARVPTSVTERFETTEDVTLTGASIADVVSEHPGGRTDHSRENADDGRHYRAFGVEAGPDCALYLGFDGDPFVGETLDLLVDFHEDDLPAPAGATDEGIEIGAEGGDPDGDGVGGPGIETYAIQDVAFRPSIEVTWQYCTAPDDWYEEWAWEDLDVLVDETIHLYRGGRVRLERPIGWETEEYGDPAQILGRETDRHWLRCVTRSRADEDANYEVPPQLDAIRTNVVRVAHRETVETADLARADGEETTGDPNQCFRFPSDRAPARAGSVHVGGEEWTAVEDFDASGPSDRHYVLDQAAGEVRFGDGRRGVIPAPDRSVVAHDIVYGGGPAGNVPVEASWQITDDGFRSVDAVSLSPPDGGRDAESIDEALARAIEERDVPHRAVTADDYRDLAMRTPGLRVARAAAIVGDGDGPVRVVVVPYSPPAIERPVPTNGFLDAVERYVGERVLLTERVRVVPPTYVPVGVTAEVHVVGDVGVEARRRAAAADLESFLDPLRGFEGEGWPFGRPVYESELYEVLESRDGIDSVRDVTVTTGGEVALDDADGALPYPDDVRVVVRSGAARCREDR
ncbi:MAG: putative baseplate assembly protein [Haloplanus sp.]